MVADASYATSLMIQKLESIFSLSSEEKQALQDLPVQVEVLKPEQDIVRIGDQPSQCCVVLEGFTCVYKLTSDGKRQILALHVPGDMPDLQSLHLQVLDISIASISSCKVGFIQHDCLRRICERHPRLTAAFWRETLVDASIYRDWILNIGQRDAYSRVAHFLCELLMRLQAVRAVKGKAFHLPITQAQLADAIGITSVHMNRVFQALRSDGLIDATRGKVAILDWERLREEGDFDPLYLHLRKPRSA
ncbi:Crp/Fnr family transcriptional regulator [Salinicola halimionae]|uniref:Crp/Fnr family transcriptional regulator n=1 Tax=Salinicola halimionae TaxID=1949081 RepID=UPI000DA21B52|nr:Crp/Fnr family transcriptional regulator [Salinicola halimionae]